MIAADHLVRFAQAKRSASMAAIFGGSVFVIGFLTAALARDDSGQHEFFTQQSAPPIMRSYADTPLRGTQAPELVIRRTVERRERHLAARRERTRVATVPVPPQRPGPQPKITLLEDRTLRRGDVVMLDQGLRVFAGAQNFPYAVTDFERIDTARGIRKEYRKILADIARTYDRELASKPTATARNAPPTTIASTRG